MSADTCEIRDEGQTVGLLRVYSFLNDSSKVDSVTSITLGITVNITYGVLKWVLNSLRNYLYPDIYYKFHSEKIL